MLLDKQLAFSEAQALTATADSTNVIDMGGAINLKANGKIQCLLNIGAKGASTPTIKVEIKGADDEAISSNVIVVAETATLSDPALGNYDVPIRQHAVKRYYRATYTLGGGGGSPTFTVTVGLFDAWQTQLVAFT